MAEIELSFGWKVARRAWFSAWSPIKDRRLDIVLGLFGVALAVARATKTGWTWSYQDLLGGLVSLLAPFVLVWVALLIWHFWLAPAALAYEGSHKASQDLEVLAQRPLEPVKAPRQPPRINWQIWKLMACFTVKEFSSLLAERDPKAGGNTNEEYAFRQLLTEQIRAGSLKPAQTVQYEFPPYNLDPKATTIFRDTAIEWAEANNFAVEHIK